MAVLEWFKGLFKSEENTDLTERKIINENLNSTESLKGLFSEEQPKSTDISFNSGSPELKNDLWEKGNENTSRERKNIALGRIVPIKLHQKQRLNICVGFDLGTSSVKTAYRVLGSPEKKISPLFLNPNNQKTPFALPSLVAFTDYGKMIIADEAESYLASRPLEDGVRFLKLLFAGQLDSEYHDEEIYGIFRKYCSKQGLRDELAKPDYLLTIFIVGVVRRARKALSELFPENELNINFNICLPIDSYQKIGIQQGFQRVLNAVQDIEPLWSEELPFYEMLPIAQSILKDVTHEKNLETRMHLIPEAVAQMASYVTSVSAEQKIHCVIDFGAGTTDFSIFNLVDESGQGRCTYWYNARTYPGGTQRIEGLIDRYYRSNGKVLSHKEVADIFSFGFSDKELKKKIKVSLERIWEESRYPVWGEAYAKNRCQGNWMSEKVEVFVCGGGSLLPFVEEVFSRSWHQEDWGPYQVKKLLPPMDFKVSNMAFSTNL